MKDILVYFIIQRGNCFSIMKSKNRGRDIGEAPTTCPILCEHYTISDRTIYISPLWLVENSLFEPIAARHKIIQMEGKLIKT